MAESRRYRSDDRDLEGKDLDLVIMPPDGNGDWYVSVLPHGDKIGPTVRITTSGAPGHQAHVAVAVAKLYQAMGGEVPEPSIFASPSARVAAHDFTTERAGWARLVAALLLDARAVRAVESEKWCHLAKEWSERADAEAAVARRELRALGVDVDGLLEKAEETSERSEVDPPASIRALFVDIDGTLNGLMTRERPSPVHKGLFLNPVLVERVNRICAATGAKVVLSSTWRDREDRYPMGHENYVSFEDVKRALRLAGGTFEVVGRTPNLTRKDTVTRDGETTDLERVRPRSLEIAAWVNEHKPRSYAIIDDDLRADLDGRLVKCDQKYGLSEDGMREAIRLLTQRDLVW